MPHVKMPDFLRRLDRRRHYSRTTPDRTMSLITICTSYGPGC